MKISEKGIEFLIREEGERLKVYKCQAGVLTIGVGHTGKDVKQGMVITKEQSRELLKQDLKRFEICVDTNINHTLKQHEFDALVSFAFNVGCEAFRLSTLRKKINSFSSNEGIANEFRKWKKGGGKVLPVLVARREREIILFLEGKYD